MSEELIEELAKAINDACCDDIGEDRDGDWELFIPEARAILPIIERERQRGYAAGIDAAERATLEVLATFTSKENPDG